MKIIIETIPHSSQRYPTCGDYHYDSDGVLHIKISELGDEKMETLVAIHELIEERLTKWRGLNEQEITDFDLYYEKRREQGLVLENSEPGFDKNAPYRNEHAIATGIELILAGHAGIDFVEYEQKINSL